MTAKLTADLFLGGAMIPSAACPNANRGGRDRRSMGILVASGRAGGVGAVSSEIVIAVVVALGGLWLVWRWIRTIALVYWLLMLAGAGWLGWRWLTSPSGQQLKGEVPGWLLSPLLALGCMVAGGIWAGRCRRAERQQPQPEKIGVNVKS